MSLFFSPYIGAGTRANPFRPTGLDIPGASAVDIRLDSTVANGGGIGYALLWLPSGVTDPIGSIKIADDYGDLLTSRQRTRLNQRTGLDFGADATIQDAVETIVLRADTLKWKRLRPANGMYELWLGSSAGKRKWVDLPVIAGGSISDAFTRANETPIASPWTLLTNSIGSMKLVSNTMGGNVIGDKFYYYSNGSGWNADQTAEFLYASTVTDHEWGPAVRIGSSGPGISGYFYRQSVVGRSASKFVDGTFTEIEAASGSTGTGNTYKISVVGSTIRYYDNGSENANSPATDTSLSTAGSGAGVTCYPGDGTIDDFLATGEIGAGRVTKNTRSAPLGIEVGMNWRG